MPTATLPTTGVCNTNASETRALSAVAIAQMQVVYKNSSNKFDLARADAAATSEVAGFARVSAGAADVLMSVLDGGLITGLSGLTQGVVYALSPDVAGDIIPLSELATTEQVSIVGIAESSSSLRIHIFNTGVAIP